MINDPRRSAVIALHWQVNVIRPEGFFGPMLAEPVAASGVVTRAARFHDALAQAGIPLFYTRFVIPDDEGQLVRNTDFMTAVGSSKAAFGPTAPGTELIPEMRAPGEVVDNQKLSGLAGNDLPQRLAERGIDTVFLTGVATNLTVEQTARHGTELGLNVYTVLDCVAAATAQTNDASLASLALATAGCLTADHVLSLPR